MIVGYLAAAFIGLALGMTGGGGAILTVPVLVYLFGLSPGLATSYSLFVVGSTSLAGAAGNFRRRLVDLRTALLFGLPSVFTVFTARKFLLPAIPDVLLHSGDFALTKDVATMILFALLMIAAAFFMLKPEALPAGRPAAPVCGKCRLVVYGVGLGLITGLLGAGGGFLLIPALVILVKLPMKTAVGTSLLIIAVNSLAGFAGDLGHYDTDWLFLLGLTAIAVAGILAGGRLARNIPAVWLKRVFGLLVLITGTYILIREIL
ncbi:sulfite exporter TauE/SafE family protein [Chitinophaga sp. 22620]|uniref:sulfite exporter TauE/SafE family protein n=1 Tax=Chitinophaga sp. 22620 TaxID=3453952 RepID=UPI003F835096